MNKAVKIVFGIMAAVSLGACSSSSASVSSSTSQTQKISTEYSETADADTIEFSDAEMEGVSYQVPEGWRVRQESGYNEMDYKSRDSKDKIEVRYIEGAGADLKGLIDTTDWHEPFTLISSEETETAGVSSLHAVGTSIIYDTIMYDCNADMYLIPTSDGTIVFEFLQDPNGTVDYAPVFARVLSTIVLK